jgi:hypothetical protein
VEMLRVNQRAISQPAAICRERQRAGRSTLRKARNNEGVRAVVSGG